MRWVAIWLVGLAMLVLAALSLSLGSASPEGAKGGVGGPLFPPQTLPIFLIAGVAFVGVGTAGALRSYVRSSAPMERGTQVSLANIGAAIGLALALLAVLAVLIVAAGPSAAQMAAGPDPCAQDHGESCFSAHPSYYQPLDGQSGGWSTPFSRVSTILFPLFPGAWPVAVGGALISLLALAGGTSRRRSAVAGLLLGSLVAIFQALVVLGFVLGAAGD